MELSSSEFKFSLVFGRRILFESFPPFIFRSVLGMELKKLACILKKNKCENCDLKFQCAYSKIFESPLQKNSEILNGRNYASHPFVLSTDITMKQKVEKLTLSITLIGDAIEYISYIYYALKKAGEKGIFRDRFPFKISNVTCNSISILASEDKLNIPKEKKTWTLNKDISEKTAENILINFKSPSRFKIKGRYHSEFSYREFIRSIFRRAVILTGLYGNISNTSDKIPVNINKDWETDFTWKDLPRYSARQKNIMKLGGITGTAEVTGKFSPFELSLLDFAEIFHTGKNPSFGLGRIKIFKKKE